MDLLVASVSLSTSALDLRGNRKRILSALKNCADADARIAVLPELCVTGYGCEDAFLFPGLVRAAWDSLRTIACEAPSSLVAVVGVPLLHRGRLYNAAAVIADGAVRGVVCKRHLARDGLHYEPRWFTPWPAGLRDRLEDGTPVGDLVYEIDGLCMGIEICEDAWAPDRPAIDLARIGVDLVLCPAASHLAPGKDKIRDQLAMDAARCGSLAYAYANLVGNEAGRVVYDGGARVVDPRGVLARTPSLDFADFQIALARVDLDFLRRNRSSQGRVAPLATERVLLAAPQPAPAHKPELTHPYGRTLEGDAQVLRAGALGLWDYLRKSRARGYALSLSGGVDSTVCAVLVHAAAHFALVDLGAAEARARLPEVNLPTDLDDPRDWTAVLLHCAYQSTLQSGSVTLRAARSVARGLGATFHKWSVEKLVRWNLDTVQPALGRRPDWTTDDIALQNIQARVRSPTIWLLANATGRVLLATSNRSELATGYATMDGDTSGGLAPVAGVSKPRLQSLLQALERDGLEGLGPWSFLGAVNRQAPTAELRPATVGLAPQTDEDDLMPYSVLQRIEDQMIGMGRLPSEINLPDIPPGQARIWIDRFCRLWTVNQWKRERAAPGLHLSERNLDPRSFLRFPILGDGFRDL